MELAGISSPVWLEGIWLSFPISTLFLTTLPPVGDLWIPRRSPLLISLPLKEAPETAPNVSNGEVKESLADEDALTHDW